jgi:alkanesulfonate monooxygenase SsuD/methylene tetrahydromethanopterin reductase-like flavin-dependent oxidoreductase (luciferase family)
VLVLPGLVTIIGETETEAQRREEALTRLIQRISPDHAKSA